MNDCYKNLCSKKDARLYFRHLAHGSFGGRLSLKKLKLILAKLGYIEIFGEDRYLELKKANTQKVEEDVRLYLERELEEKGNFKVWWDDLDLHIVARNLAEAILSVLFVLALLSILISRLI